MNLLQSRSQNYPLSIAPMLDWTDRHYRFFMRQLSKRSLLYTEMITTNAILHGDRDYLLAFAPEEKPLALQLGGDDPKQLADCARIAEDLGFDEVNLNVGCPSDRVQNGHFGVCLMAKPEVVAAGVAAMRKAVKLPVTVKQRIGIDNLDRYEDMANFVQVVAQAGADRFIVHARKAWLSGLSPKENRNIPPLRYEDVYRLKEEFPQLQIEINGGIKTFAQARAQLKQVDGVMIGRAAYENPYLFATADQEFFNAKKKAPTRREVVLAMLPYIDNWQNKGLYPNKITRHMLGLFARQPGAKSWKRYLSENAHKPSAKADSLLKAISAIPAEVLDSRPDLGALIAV